MTAPDTEIMQAASNLHDQVRHACFRQAQDLFDNPTPFDTRNHVFHHYTRTGEEAIEQPLPRAQLLPFGLFFTCLGRTPAGA